MNSANTRKNHNKRKRYWQFGCCSRSNLKLRSNRSLNVERRERIAYECHDLSHCHFWWRWLKSRRTIIFIILAVLPRMRTISFSRTHNFLTLFFSYFFSLRIFALFNFPITLFQLRLVHIVEQLAAGTKPNFFGYKTTREMFRHLNKHKMKNVWDWMIFQSCFELSANARARSFASAPLSKHSE